MAILGIIAVVGLFGLIGFFGLIASLHFRIAALEKKAAEAEKRLDVIVDSGALIESRLGDVANAFQVYKQYAKNDGAEA